MPQKEEYIDKYEPTEKQVNFFMSASRQFAMENDLLDILKNPESLGDKQFEHLKQQMFDSEDKELKIDFSVVLMRMGFVTMTKICNLALTRSMIKSGHPLAGLFEAMDKKAEKSEMVD